MDTAPWFWRMTLIACPTMFLFVGGLSVFQFTAMSALEREIIEKFHQLQPAAKQWVRLLIEQETAAKVAQSVFDYDDWFRIVETLRQQIRISQGDKQSIDVIGMLRDIRDG
jgi:hypothetical protein